MTKKQKNRGKNSSSFGTTLGGSDVSRTPQAEGLKNIGRTEQGKALLKQYPRNKWVLELDSEGQPTPDSQSTLISIAKKALRGTEKRAYGCRFLCEAENTPLAFVLVGFAQMRMGQGGMSQHKLDNQQRLLQIVEDHPQPPEDKFLVARGLGTLLTKDAVAIKFMDKTRAHCNLLEAASGLESRTRKRVLNSITAKEKAKAAATAKAAAKAKAEAKAKAKAAAVKASRSSFFANLKQKKLEVTWAPKVERLKDLATLAKASYAQCMDIPKAFAGFVRPGTPCEESATQLAAWVEVGVDEFDNLIKLEAKLVEWEISESSLASRMSFIRTEFGLEDSISPEGTLIPFREPKDCLGVDQFRKELDHPWWYQYQEEVEAILAEK